MSDERGLVISPPIEISRGSVFVRSSSLDPQELRFALLFWDKLDFPEQHHVAFGLNPDSQFLLEANVLQRTRVQVPGGEMGDILRAAHVSAFRALNDKEPGQWSIATGERSISFSDNDLEVGRGALVRLHEAIPVPDKDVPLQDILEFRAKRRSELLALRHHLDSIYQRVLAAGDGALALNTEVEALQAAIADHIRASKETGFKFRAVSLNASLNLIKGATVAAGALALGLPTVAALMAGTGAAINVGPGTALTWGKPTGIPFRYVSAYHHEVF
jgi:hypothetical protein